MKIIQSKSEITPFIPKVAELYKKVFATPPWNEAYKCSACSKQYGQTEFPSDLLCPCGEVLQEYYNTEKLIADIQEISSRTSSLISLALPESQLGGFCWGWEDSLDQINRDKLRLPNSTLNSGVMPLSVDDNYFYLSEFGIDPALRGRGFGKTIFRATLETQSAKSIIMRTNTGSPAFFIAQKSGFQKVYTYPDRNDTVLLIK